jgi:hypothetical protein
MMTLRQGFFGGAGAIATDSKRVEKRKAAVAGGLSLSERQN